MACTNPSSGNNSHLQNKLQKELDKVSIDDKIKDAENKLKDTISNAKDKVNNLVKNNPANKILDNVKNLSMAKTHLKKASEQIGAFTVQVDKSAKTAREDINAINTQVKDPNNRHQLTQQRIERYKREVSEPLEKANKHLDKAKDHLDKVDTDKTGVKEKVKQAINDAKKSINGKIEKVKTAAEDTLKNPGDLKADTSSIKRTIDDAREVADNIADDIRNGNYCKLMSDTWNGVNTLLDDINNLGIDIDFDPNLELLDVLNDIIPEPGGDFLDVNLKLPSFDFLSDLINLLSDPCKLAGELFCSNSNPFDCILNEMIDDLTNMGIDIDINILALFSGIFKMIKQFIALLKSLLQNLSLHLHIGLNLNLSLGMLGKNILDCVGGFLQGMHNLANSGIPDVETNDDFQSNFSALKEKASNKLNPSNLVKVHVV